MMNFLRYRKKAKYSQNYIYEDEDKDENILN